MLSKLKGVLVVVIGLLIVVAIIWWGWPILHSAIAGEPKHSVLIRLILIGLVVGGWLAYHLIKWLLAKSASSALMAAVSKSAQKEQPSADALRLRERFEEAVGTLKQGQRRGHSLYELPWYVIIGAPGAGKTTVLVNSGLHFPIAQRGQQGAALRGIGGTRNCDWWFTDEAVFLDTAGRYTTQDSDAGADSAAWGEFLLLLKKYRQRRPLNGVIVAMSAVDVMTQGQAAREGHVAAVRRRIEELNERLGVRLPIYVLITKCDLIAGFSEYFDDLTAEGRAQVWGVTFPAERTRNAEAAEGYPGEFDALVTRLNERVLGRVEDERDPRRRAAAFGFPHQMAVLRQPLTQFVSEVFASTKFERAIQLRGVYFTSGTQEGTPIDRLLGALGRRFGTAAEAVASGSRGKAYFIERLLKEVMIPESGIAGVNRWLEIRKGALQLAAYVGMAAFAVLMLVLLAVNYAASRDYLGKVDGAVQAVRGAPPAGPGSPRDAIIRRLAAVRRLMDVAGERYLPFYRAWALNSRSSAGEAAELAYASQLNILLVPRMAAGIERRIESGPPPEELYDALRSYLVLGAARRDKLEQAFFSGVSWDDPGGGNRLVAHMEWLLARPEAMRLVELNNALVARAQATMRSIPPERLAYRDVEKRVEDKNPKKLRIDEEAGIGADKVLRFISNRPLSTPLPALYTREVFNAITADDASQLKEIVADRTKYDWVWGTEGPPNGSSDVDEVTGKVLDRYEDEYIRAWEGIISDITVVSVSGLSSLKGLLNDVTADGSPLRGWLLLIKKHTQLVEPPKGEPTKSLLDKTAAPVKNLLGGPTGPPRGTKITQRFSKYHAAVAGVEPLIATLAKMKEQLAASGDGPGEKPPTPDVQRETRETAAALEARSGLLPESFAALAKRIASSALAVVGRGAAMSFRDLYRAQVVPECEMLVSSRYPFVKDSPNSIPIKDFESLFGYGGVFDRFANEELQKYADITPARMEWRPGSPVSAGAILRQFEAARRIRETFFEPGSKSVGTRFDVQIVDANLAQSPKKVLFKLELNEHSLTWEGFPRNAVPVKWPGPKSFGLATWNTEPPLNLPDEPFSDDWAWFRLVDAGELKQDGPRDTRYLLTLKKGARTAEIVIQAANVRNPFGARDALRGFPCGTATP